MSYLFKDYGREIWEYIKAENMMNVHRKCSKRLLGVYKSIDNLSAYSELERFSSYIYNVTT